MMIFNQLNLNFKLAESVIHECRHDNEINIRYNNDTEYCSKPYKKTNYPNSNRNGI